MNHKNFDESSTSTDLTKILILMLCLRVRASPRSHCSALFLTEQVPGRALTLTEHSHSYLGLRERHCTVRQLGIAVCS